MDLYITDACFVKEPIYITHYWKIYLNCRLFIRIVKPTKIYIRSETPMTLRKHLRMQQKKKKSALNHIHTFNENKCTLRELMKMYVAIPWEFNFWIIVIFTTSACSKESANVHLNWSIWIHMFTRKEKKKKNSCWVKNKDEIYIWIESYIQRKTIICYISISLPEEEKKFDILIQINICVFFHHGK